MVLDANLVLDRGERSWKVGMEAAATLSELAQIIFTISIMIRLIASLATNQHRRQLFLFMKSQVFVEFWGKISYLCGHGDIIDGILDEN